MEKDIPTEDMMMKMLAYRPYKKDRRSVAQNSGIRIEAFDPLGVKITYYRYI
jgi:hypothetical protein